MNVGLWIVRHVNVEHVSDTWNIETTCRYVGRHNDVQTAILEGVDHALTLVLGNVTVQRSSFVAFGFKGAGQIQGRLLGANEHDQGVEIFNFQQAQYSRGLLVSVNQQVSLFDRGNGLSLGLDLHVLRIAQMAFGNGTDRLRQGCREQYGLTGWRKCLEDNFKIVHETQFQHFVSFVQNQVVHGRQHFFVTTQVVAQTARSGDNDLCAITDCFQLWTHRGAAVNGHNGNARHLLGVGFESGCYLQRQLTGWRQDQGLRLALSRIDAVQDRQGERGGFTRTGLRLTNHVVTGHDDRDRLLLNSRRFFVASRDDSRKNVRIKIKSGEAAGFLGHGSASKCIRKDPCSKAAHAV